MGILRSYREFLARFWPTMPDRAVDIDVSMVQPVIILDDQRDLAPHPILQIYAGSAQPIAAVGRFGVVYVYPSGPTPIRVMRAFLNTVAGANVFWGVRSRSDLPAIGNGVGGDISVLQGELTLSGFGTSARTVNIDFGDVASVTGLLDDNQPVFPEGLLVEINLIVLPGQMLIFFADTPNVALNFPMIVAADLPWPPGDLQQSLGRK